MAERLLIIGGGGHGRVVADAARAAGYLLAGFVDADPAKLGCIVEPGGAAVVAAQTELLDDVAAGRPLPAAAGAVAIAIGNNMQRLKLAFELADVSLPPVIHPSSVVSPSARLGRGSVVLPTAVVNANADIGIAVIINTAAVVEHDCHVGDGAHVSPGAVLSGGVRVGARSWIGAGATVIQGVRVGDDAVVGAGSVVIRDVPDRETVMGVPARAPVTEPGADTPDPPR